MDRRHALRLRWRGEADAIGVCLARLAWLLLPARRLWLIARCRGLTCLIWLFRLIQRQELSRLLRRLLLLRLLRLGRDRGRAPFLVRGPALFHGNCA